MAVTVRPAMAAFDSFETIPAIVPPTPGGLSPAPITGPGWHPPAASKPSASNACENLMMRLG
jgi:hypothetical protein